MHAQTTLLWVAEQAVSYSEMEVNSHQYDPQKHVQRIHGDPANHKTQVSFSVKSSQTMAAQKPQRQRNVSTLQKRPLGLL